MCRRHLRTLVARQRPAAGNCSTRCSLRSIWPLAVFSSVVGGNDDNAVGGDVSEGAGATMRSIRSAGAARHWRRLVVRVGIRVSAAGHNRKLAGHRGAAAHRAVHGKRSAQRLDTVFEPEQS
jgi:hypothetical protein